MRQISLGIVLLFGLTACIGSDGNVVSVSPPALQPYQTSAPDATLIPLPPLTEIFLPTPTPFPYTVKNGDTMGSIASRFNVTLDALLAANPGVDPDALSIGTVLVIPEAGAIISEPTSTPAALTVRQVRCWPETSGGLWCFGLVQNKFGTALENLSAQFVLLDPSGNEVASQVVFGLLDILPAGQEMPLAAHFPTTVSAQVTPRLQILTAIMLLPEDTRYLPVTLHNILVEMNASGRTAQVTGQAMPVILDGQVNTIWLLGVAYDSAGNVIGVHRWESVTPMPGGVSLPFSFIVSSVGPAIDRVELLVEARP